MKSRSGNSHQNKIAENFQNSKVQTWRKKNQEVLLKYRQKVKEVNETNAKFIAFAKEQAPWLVEKFFSGDTVK